MRVEHINILLTLVENQLIKSPNFGQNKVWLNENSYALLKKSREPEQNDNLFHNSTIWRKMYKKHRPNSKTIDFKPAELGLMSSEKWNVEELQAFFDSDYFLFNIKSIRIFVSKISELRDWILSQQEDKPVKSQHPNNWDVKYYKTLVFGAEISSYREHLRNLGFVPVMNTTTNKLIKWQKE
jgi:hypothetical protein